MLLSIDGCIARADKDSRENLAASGEKRMSTTSLTRRAVLKAAALTRLQSPLRSSVPRAWCLCRRNALRGTSDIGLLEQARSCSGYASNGRTRRRWTSNST